MKTIEGFKLRKLGNEYILVGESMALINFNKMITLLWQKAEEATAQKGAFTATDLCGALCDEYEVDPSQAMTDVQATVASWLEAGVIEE